MLLLVGHNASPSPRYCCRYGARPTTKLTRRRKGARNEQTVGGRVQRLVVLLVGWLVFNR